MMDRLSFLKRTAITLAGGLLVGDEALAAFERLTHRKVFALGGIPQVYRIGPLIVDRFQVEGHWHVAAAMNMQCPDGRIEHTRFGLPTLGIGASDESMRSKQLAYVRAKALQGFQRIAGDNPLYVSGGMLDHARYGVQFGNHSPVFL